MFDKLTDLAPLRELPEYAEHRAGWGKKKE